MKYSRGKHPNSRRDNRKYHINHNYFSNITIENSYYAGFIAGDGCVTRKKENNLVLSLQNRDKYILENFLSATNSTYNISTRKNESVISIISEQICSDLYKNFNITSRKSLTLKPPNFKDKDCIDLYIKGIIDADGCIILNEKYGLSIHFCGTEHICNYLLLRFNEILENKISQNARKETTQCYSFKVSDKAAREIFIHYYNKPYGLNRKWSEFKYNYCKNWQSKRFNIEKCKIIYNLLKNHSIKEISELYQCTYANIHLFINSNMYKKFIISIKDEN